MFYLLRNSFDYQVRSEYCAYSEANLFWFAFLKFNSSVLYWLTVLRMCFSCSSNWFFKKTFLFCITSLNLTKIPKLGENFSQCYVILNWELCLNEMKVTFIYTRSLKTNLSTFPKVNIKLERPTFSICPLQLKITNT